jgi:hypothetical protein
MKAKIEHIGLSLKTIKQHQQEHILPYLLPGSKRTIEEIMAVHKSPIPLCWNYDVKQYPLSYHVNGLVDEHDDSGFLAHECDEYEPSFTQESVEVGIAAAFSKQHYDLTDVNAGQILQRVKKVLAMNLTASQRVSLYESIVKCEKNIRMDIIEKQGNRVLGLGDPMHVSLNLPHNTDRESRNFSYSRKSSKNSNKRQRINSTDNPH